MAAANPEHGQNTEKPHCPICLGEFKTPRQLPCLHSFCQCCLEDYISSKAAKMDELKECECPICRTIAPIPRKSKTSKMWASLFPIDSILQSIEGKEEEDRPCDCCVSDGVSATAHGFCVECEEAMCETCLKVHQRLKAAKNHSIVAIEELTKSPQNLISLNKGFRCQEHEEKELKFYCRDHKIACCSSCCIIHHRNCGQVTDLRKDAKNLVQEVKPLHVLEEMKTFENYLMNFEKKNDSNIVSLESHVQDMTNKIQEIRKKINDLLDDLELKVKSEGNQLYKQEAIRKQEQNHACQALLNAVRKSHVTLDTVLKHGNDMQIFLIADRMISQVKLYYEHIKEKFGETETATLNLEVDPQMQFIMAQRSDIGRVICRKKRKRCPIPRAEKPLKECQVEMEKFVEVKGPDDKNPWYRGVTYLQEDQVMLTDCNNKRVLLLSSSYQCISCFTLPDEPYDICVGGDRQTVAVSIPNQKTIQFLSVTSGTIKPTRMVQTRYKCQGVAPAGNGNIIVSGHCNDRGKHYWSLITSTGEEKYHQFDCQCNHSVTYTALNSSCTRVYITVWNANSLYCFDMDGRMMYKYNHDNLKCPLGVATDRDDNVYVVGCRSHNIHQLTSDGSTTKIINDDIPKNPRAICFNNSHDKFLIMNDTEEAAKKIYLFRFK